MGGCSSGMCHSCYLYVGGMKNPNKVRPLQVVEQYAGENVTQGEISSGDKVRNSVSHSRCNYVKRNSAFSNEKNSQNITQTNSNRLKTKGSNESSKNQRRGHKKNDGKFNESYCETVLNINVPELTAKKPDLDNKGTTKVRKSTYSKSTSPQSISKKRRISLTPITSKIDSRLNYLYADFEKERQSLFESTEQFIDTDKRALTAPSYLKKSQHQLVDYLIKPFLDSDLKKIRVIWMWITHNILYDVESYFNPMGSSKHKPENALLTGKSVCAGYGNLFKAMGKLAGLTIECISGWSKGYNYSVGSTFDGEGTNHVWNAVFLNDLWWLLDSTWGAGHVDKYKTFVKQYNEYFFMTDPKTFIYDHFPEDPKWQLLDRTITLREFERMGHFNHRFFQCRLEAITHGMSIVQCDDGRIHMMFKTPSEKSIGCIGSLRNNHDIEESVQQMLIYNKDSVLHVHVLVPDIGNYMLDLYVGSTVGGNRANESTFPLVCSYLINCTHKLERPLMFPKQYRDWKRGFVLLSPMECPLVAGNSYNFRILVTDHLKEMAICYDGRITAVISVDSKKEIWESNIHIPLNLQKLHIAAKFLHHSKNSFSYLLEYAVAIDSTGSRKVKVIGSSATLSGQSNEDEGFILKYLKPINHTNFHINCIDGRVHLRFEILDGGKIDWAGSVRNSEGIEENKQQLLICAQDSVLDVRLLISNIGTYTLNLYSSCTNPPSQEIERTSHYSLVCCYLINCTYKLERPLKFPRQYGDWKRGFLLLSPMECPLIAGRTYNFRIMVTEDVKEMAICLDGKIVEVTSTKTDTNQWESDTNIPGKTGRVHILARFVDSGEGSFSYLLEYDVIAGFVH